MVFDNSVEDDGVFHAATDPGLNGVTVTLTGTDDLGNPVSLTTTTRTIKGQAGSYDFAGLNPSNAAGYTITQTGVGIPAGDLTGKVSPNGSLGGSQILNQDSAVVVAAGDDGVNYDFSVVKPAQVSGVVFDNSVEDDGVFHAATDPGLNGVTVTLTGMDDLGNPVNLSTTTTTIAGQAGSYDFTGLRPSNGAGYTVSKTGAGVPAGFIDGKPNAPGSLGGQQPNQTADQVTAVPVAAGADGLNYNFDEIQTPASLSGTVFSDYNNDGVENGPDQGIAGVTITLTGTDIYGRPVNLTTTTAVDGSYAFTGLAPGSYTVTETQPGNYVDGKDILGSAGGANAVKNQFESIVLDPGEVGTGYNFGETFGGLPGGVVPPFVAPTGPEVDPTFVSKAQLLGSGMDGVLAGDVAYVNALYQQVLGRPADIDGLNTWVFQLDSGVSREQVADEIWPLPRAPWLAGRSVLRDLLAPGGRPDRQGRLGQLLPERGERDGGGGGLRDVGRVPGEPPERRRVRDRPVPGRLESGAGRNRAGGVGGGPEQWGESGGSRPGVPHLHGVVAGRAQPPVCSVPRPRRGQRGRTGVSAALAERRPSDHAGRRQYSQLERVLQPIPFRERMKRGFTTKTQRTQR